jgi:hypothetical protein
MMLWDINELIGHIDLNGVMDHFPVKAANVESKMLRTENVLVCCGTIKEAIALHNL